MLGSLQTCKLSRKIVIKYDPTQIKADAISEQQAVFTHKTPGKTSYLMTIWESPALLGLVLPVHKLPQQNYSGDTEGTEFIPVYGLQGVGMFSSLLSFRLTLLFMDLIKPEECTWLNPSEK